MKIYIVEDEIKMRQELGMFLTKNGYEVEIEEDLKNVIRNIESKNIDLILLDVNLPYEDGYYICTQVRKKMSIPIIILTSQNSQIDELTALNYGADDYVTKPYNPQILLGRINNILRRVKTVNETLLDCNMFKIDITKGILLNADKKIELTKNELKILVCLYNKKGQIVTREEIIEALWDSYMFVDDNTLTVNMTRIRKKVEEIGAQDVIITKRGMGYILDV